MLVKGQRYVYDLKISLAVAGGKIKSLPNNGTIEAPSIPNEVFEKGYSCKWKLEKVYKSNPILFLDSMDLDFASGCTRDVLEIKTVEEKIRLCDPANKTALKVSSASIEVTFVPTKNSNKRRQFKFRYLCKFLFIDRIHFWFEIIRSNYESEFPTTDNLSRHGR